MKQAIFKFEEFHDYSPENFLVSESNRDAFEFITSSNWSSYGLNIYGSKSCGKSYLCEIAKSQFGDNILIIDDFANGGEELFHKIENAKNNGLKVLITSQTPLAEIKIEPADLKSRLVSFPSIEIQKPDEHLLYMLLARLFAAKQISVSDEVLNFLSMRINNSFARAFEIANSIDKLSLEQKRNITIPLVKECL